MENGGFKVVLIGDSSVGKTSLVYWFMYKRQPLNTFPTIGAAFAARSIKINNREIKLNIWDTAGQERFKSLARMYYNNSVACICVFDITNINSFKSVDIWIRDFKENNYNNDYIIIVVANKCDLPQYLWQVSIGQVKEYCDNNKYLYTYTNCINGEGTYELFENVANKISGLKIAIDYFSNNDIIKISDGTNKCVC